MFVFIKKIFYIGSLFLSSLVSTTSSNCISMKNQECKVRSEIINVNSTEPTCQELMKQGIENGMKHVSVNVD